MPNREKEETTMATAQKDLHNQASNMADHAKDMAKDVASDVANKAKDIGSTVAQKASDTASYMGKKAEDATSSVGAGMKNLAGTIREHVPEKGMLGSAGSAVADTLESGGRYLQQQGLSGIGDDLTNMIRRNPIPSVLLCLGVGYLLARATTNRS